MQKDQHEQTHKIFSALIEVYRGTSVGDILIRKTDLEDVQSVSRQTGSDWLVTPSMSAINRWVLTQQK